MPDLSVPDHPTEYRLPKLPWWRRLLAKVRRDPNVPAWEQSYRLHRGGEITSHCCRAGAVAFPDPCPWH